MKSVIVLAIALLTYAGSYSQHKLEKIWETDSVVAIPESVYADVKKWCAVCFTHRRWAMGG